MRRFILGVALLAASGLAVYSVTATTTGAGGLILSDIVSVGAADKSSSDPFLVASPAGEVLLSWTEKPAPKDRGRNAFIAALNGQGMPVAPRRINDIDGQVHWYGGDNRLKFAVAGDGSITALWQAPLGGEFKTGNVYTAWAPKDGAFTPSKILNDDTNERPVAHAFSTVAAAPNGKIYASWIDGRNRTFTGMGQPETTAERRADIKMRDLTIPEYAIKAGPQQRRDFAEPNSQLYMAVSEDGGRTFGKNYSITNISVCACCVPNIAFLENGERVIVSYRNVTDEHLRDNVVIRSDNGGQSFSDPKYFSNDGWIARFCPHAGPSMISTAPGKLHLLWFTAGTDSPGDEGIYYAASDDGGATFSPRQRLAATPSHTVLHTQIVSDASGRLWAVWENFAEGEMRPRIYMAHRGPGDPSWSKAVQVSEANAVSSMLPTIAANNGNRVYVAWIEMNGEASQVKVRTAAPPVS